MKLEHGIYVMMPVLCIGKICNDCEYLKIDTEVGMDKNENGRFVSYTNLKCRSVNRCLKIQQMMDQEETNVRRHERTAEAET